MLDSDSESELNSHVATVSTCQSVLLVQRYRREFKLSKSLDTPTLHEAIVEGKQLKTIIVG